MFPNLTNLWKARPSTWIYNWSTMISNCTLSGSNKSRQQKCCYVLWCSYITLSKPFRKVQAVLVPFQNKTAFADLILIIIRTSGIEVRFVKENFQPTDLSFVLFTVNLDSNRQKLFQQVYRELPFLDHVEQMTL